MIRIRRYCFILLSLFVLSSGHAIYAAPENHPGPPPALLKNEAEMAIKRSKFVMTDKVWAVLAIKPGMTILDIGTGTGQFAYEFAGRLKGTGRVFATDISLNCLNYVKEEAARRGLENIHPVLVGREGVDEFYGKNKFDLITLFNVFTGEYETVVAYLKGLRSSLAEGGRLIVMDYRKFTPFSQGDFTDFKGLVKKLSQEPVDSLFLKVLREPTKKLIQNSTAEPGEDVKRAIVEDFNHILSDKYFGLNFIKGTAFNKEAVFSPEERDWADYLLLRMIPEGIFEANRDKKTFLPPGRQTLARIYTAQMNKLLIIQRFRQYLDKDRMFISESAPRIRNAFEKAGYKLEKDYGDLVFSEDLLVFTAPAVLSSASEKSKDKQMDALAAQREYKDPVTGMEFVFVKGGCYEMGEDFNNHVCVDDFYMGKYDVTQGQWKEIMGDNPSNFGDCGNNCPVEFVSWNDVQKFIKKLNEKMPSLSPPLAKGGDSPSFPLSKGGQRGLYRLPTEAEWEYAARSGGRKEKWAGTNSESELGDYAWYVDNSGNKTHPVGSKKSNGLGLYDMSGNVWQCMQDRLDESPRAPGDEGNIRMLRGGSWSMGAWFARTAFRIALHPDVRGNDIGFRLARSR